MKQLFSGEGPNVVVIGGGTGVSVILRGLKNITDNLAAIVTMADDGGGSGMLREDLGMLPPGDVRSCLLALADVESDFEELFQYRFTEGMLKGQNFGNLILAALNCMAGSFEEGLAKAHDIFRLKGRVIPVTCQEITLCARLSGGTIVRGESSIPKTVLAGEGRIEEVFLEPSGVQTIYQARTAIKQADVIIIGPGSLYTSLIPNLLVGGIGDEIRKSEAPKVLICNVMTQPGETDGFRPIDHVEEVLRYLNDGTLDYAVINTEMVDEKFSQRYMKDGSMQVLMGRDEKERIEEFGLQVIDGNFVNVKLGYIRHDADKIAEVIRMILEKKSVGVKV